MALTCFLLIRLFVVCFTHSLFPFSISVFQLVFVFPAYNDAERGQRDNSLSSIVLGVIFYRAYNFCDDNDTATAPRANFLKAYNYRKYKTWMYIAALSYNITVCQMSIIFNLIIMVHYLLEQ